MTNTEARAYFDAAIALATNPDTIARLELCREYFTNEDFRSALHDHVYRINTGAHDKVLASPADVREDGHVSK